jgi:hypothetical protein
MIEGMLEFLARARTVGVLGAALCTLVMCSVSTVDYEGKACPCPSPFVCNEATRKCVREIPRGGTGGDGATSGTSGSANGGSGSPSSGGSDAGGSAGASGATTGGRSNTGGKGGTSSRGGTGTGGRTGTGGSADGGDPGIGGTGGTAGSDPGGAGGAGGEGEPACHEILFENRNTFDIWIDDAKTCLDMRGQVSFDPGSTSDLYPSVKDGHLCLRGVARPNGYPEAILNIGNGQAYDAATNGVTGFSFTISGPQIPEDMRFGFFEMGGFHCVNLAGPNDYSVLLRDARINCFSGIDTGRPDTATIYSLVFLVMAPPAGEVPFDFCIEGFWAKAPP